MKATNGHDSINPEPEKNIEPRKHLAGFGIRTIAIGFTAFVFIILGICGCYFPNVGPPPNISVSMTSEQISRGDYLVNHVAACAACHSKQDYTKLWYPVIPGTVGAGGRQFHGPGEYYAANLTSSHLGDWTDGEILRAITSGVNKDGKALFPIMPYLSYGKMDRQDAEAIIAYLRTLKPIENNVPASHSTFPMNLINNTIPAKAHFEPMPDHKDVVQYGAYLANIAGCVECHTQRGSFGKLKKGFEFAGGEKFPLPTGGTIRSANITPNTNSGIGAWSKEVFIARFKSCLIPAVANSIAKTNAPNSIMPWTSFAGMTDEDLGAIYAYLRTVKPVENSFVKFTSEENSHSKPLAKLSTTWVLANPAITSAVLGTSRFDQLTDALSAVDLKIGAELRVQLDDITVEYQRGDAVR